MARIQQIIHTRVCGRIRRVKLIGAYGHAFQPDAEHLALYTVYDVGARLCKHLVQRRLQAQPRAHAVRRNILEAVRHPYIVEHLIRCAMRRLALQWSIQKRRTASSG